jgi:hypothetical protein
MKLALYQIEQEYMILADSIISNGGELTPELETALEINREQLEAKGRGYGFVIKDVESELDAIDNEIKRLQALKQSRNKAIDLLKEKLSNAMQLFDVAEIKTPTLKINFRKSESVEIENPSLLDKKFMVVKTTEQPDKMAIKEAIKQGESVQGATISINYNLQIK